MNHFIGSPTGGPESITGRVIDMAETRNDVSAEKANFLLEIGTEEIPAGYLPPAIESIGRAFRQKLEENRIGFDGVTVYATPRRLVVLASGVADGQEAGEEELKGPAAKAAYDASGKPTKALEGFARGNGIDISTVYRRETDKGEYVFAKRTIPASKTVDIIPPIIEHIVNSLPFPKRMRWSDKKVTFPRPIRYFLIMFNDAVIPLTVEGISSAGMTRGHFIQNNRMLEVKRIADYERVLRENNVVVNQEERKELIRRELDAAAKAVNGTALHDEELLDIVTFLVEKPNVVTCEFDPDFLKIPDIVLITEMKEHQKYFAVLDKSGKLMNRFLVVSNNPPTEHVKAGNERVIAARFTDGGFFFREDRKQKLEGFVESLKNVLFHKELGTIYQKMERVSFVADAISSELSLDDAVVKKILRSIHLGKADLNTAMVFEFSSLQGKIGRVYALLDGEDAEVADAIDGQYRPRFSGDELPKSVVGAVVSISEKIDNIFGSYSVGNIPKGSQDPYALRRQANAVVEMIIEAGLKLNLDAVMKKIAPQYRDGASLVDKILEFITARAKTIFTDRGFRYDEIDACLSIGFFDYLELYRRAKSLNEFRKNENFTQMLLSFKRMNNIYSAFRQKNAGYALSFSKSLLAEDAEKGLFAFFDSKKGEIDGLISGNRYIELFELLIGGKAIIDAFFDKVMVMAEDKAVRDNRLALLEGILRPFASLLDFSKISE